MQNEIIENKQEGAAIDASNTGLELDIADITAAENRTKQETSEVIEAMLDEIGMSKQELIDLLVGGIKIDKHVEIEIGSEILIHIEGLSEQDIEQLGIQGADVDGLLAAVAEGRSRFKIFEFFNFAKILQILSKTSVIFNLEILKRLGLDISPLELERLFKVEQVKELDNRNLRMQLATGVRMLSQVEIDKLKNYSQDKISSVSNQVGGQTTVNSSQKRSLAADHSAQMQMNAAAHDPSNEQAQQAGRANAQAALQQQRMGKGLKWLRDKTRDIRDRFKNTLNKVEKKIEGFSMSMAIAEAEQLNEVLSRFGARVKNAYKEVSSVQFKGKEVHVTLENGNSMNLRNFLADKGHYNAEVAKLIDEAGSANAELLKILGNLQKRIAQGSELSYGDSRMLEINIQTDKTVTKLQVLDYLQDLRNFLQGKDSRRDVNTTLIDDASAKGQKKQSEKPIKLSREKKQSSKTVNSNSMNATDKKTDATGGSSEAAQAKDTSMPIQLDVIGQAAEVKQVSIKTEVDDLRKDLIKIDAMNDAKKHLMELQEAKQLFSKGMSAMGEASKNNTADVMKQMQEKMQGNKQIG